MSRDFDACGAVAEPLNWSEMKETRSDRVSPGW